MAAFNLEEELVRPVYREPTLTESLTDQPNPANAAADRATPPIMMIWARGEQVDEAEAVRRATKAFRLPPHDAALASAVLADLTAAGWLTRSVDPATYRPTYLRPEIDPPDPATAQPTKPRQIFWRPAFTRMKKVELPSGDFIEIPEQVPESYVSWPDGAPATAAEFGEFGGRY